MISIISYSIEIFKYLYSEFSFLLLVMVIIIITNNRKHNEEL